ncbi:hypothetical protein HRG84_13420 [Flavisolibacter sp. BT320]|nr:hypothetical protein [Flavisolibacter longurius]
MDTTVLEKKITFLPSFIFITAARTGRLHKHFKIDTKMYKAIILINLFFILAISAKGQYNPELKLHHLKAVIGEKYSYQFSSMVIKGDSLILGAEKCGKIYILNKSTLDTIGIKYLPKDKIISLEGMSLYKNRYLFLLDEGSVGIYVFDLEGKDSLRRIADKKELGRNRNKLEGIAINNSQSICYVLQEEKGEIYVYNILDNLVLKIYDTVKIYNSGEWTRHTDLVYDDNLLYALKTNFKRELPQNLVKYAIDIMKISAQGKPQNDAIRYVNLNFCKDFSACDGNYSTNLEGLTIDNNIFYIISDNEWGATRDCAIWNKRFDYTLLLKFTKDW